MGKEAELGKLGELLHEKLLSGKDIRVTAEIAELFLPLLTSHLRRKFGSLGDPHAVESAAIDSLMAYFENPEKFKPERGSLLQYLFMDARYNVVDALRTRTTVEVPFSPIEYILQGQVEFDDPECELTEWNSPLLRQVLALIPDQTDREIVSLMIEGVRETAEYSSVLGIEDRPGDEQAAVVKRHKDRLKKVLQRGIKR